MLETARSLSTAQKEETRQGRQAVKGTREEGRRDRDQVTRLWKRNSMRVKLKRKTHEKKQKRWGGRKTDTTYEEEFWKEPRTKRK
ncbi:hypothetical protein E2C01_066728 [Portunus trituberculatus]|uniref:Uncharacterized protein n=1 Tax=Portunus trituberculatus TaxID=210409 RepID=A0A5B7HQK7_PORTR|nr:hypothetical protein [Portunus trituberculatus]